MNISGIRKEVLTAEAYVSGKSMEQVKKDYNLTRVIKLGSNENPYGPFPNSSKAMTDEVLVMNRYPEVNFIKLRQLLGEKNGFDSTYVGLGHGAGGVLETIARLFIEKDDEVIVPRQSYRLYREISKLMGGIVKEVQLDENYTISIDRIIKTITPKTKLIWICNPNNPTGTIFNKNDFDKLLNSLPENAWIVLDEAYSEFADRSELPDPLEYIKQGKRILCVRTFSKYYGIAGARMGYVIASPNVINGFDTVSEPFNASRSALAAAIACVTKDKENCENAFKMMFDERERVTVELEKEGLEVAKANANFLFFKVPCNGAELAELLLSRGVIIRSCGGWGYPNHLRVTIGIREEMDEFLEKLKQCLKELSKV